MAQAVYLLCAGASLMCAWLLVRGYRRTPVRLLFWTATCFVGLTINNTLLFIDLVMVPGVDLSIWRGLTALASLSLLLFGLIWESR